MSNDFKILNEETFTSKKKEDLCLMLIMDGGRYAIECVSTKDSFGRKFLNNRLEAEDIFNFFVDNFSKRNYGDMLNILSLCYTMTSITEIKFMFDVYNKLMSQAAIGKLVKKFNLTVKPKYDTYGHLKMKGMLTIDVYFKKKKRFGIFKGTFLKNDFEFELL